MLYIIVPVHNRLSITLRFIESLQNQKYNNYQLIIVDDGSTDGTSEFIHAHFPNIIVIQGNGDLFWGGAINLGLKHVSEVSKDDDYIAFANNDVVMENNTIEELLKVEKGYNGLALFHSLVKDKTSKCFTSGSKLLSWPLFWTYHPFRGQDSKLCIQKPIALVDLATARFIIFRKLVLNHIKGINTGKFIHYLGDCDFSYSLKKKNICTFIVPSSQCIIDNTTTGENAGKLVGFKQFIKSLNSIKSSNNLFLRFRFGRIHCPFYFFPFYCCAITLQVIIINLIIRKSYN